MPKTVKPVNLGEKLREAIKRKGVSQADVARHFKVKPPTVSGDWLKRGTIDKKHYPELVNYFGLPYEWWFGKSEEDAESDNRKKLLSIVDKLEEDAIGVLAQMAFLMEKQAQSPTDSAVDTQQSKPIELTPPPKRLGTKEGYPRDNTDSPIQERRKRQIQVVNDRRKGPWNYKGECNGPAIRTYSRHDIP